MKKIILAASIAMIVSTSAFAADMGARPYTKAPPMAVPMYNWTGIYIGAHVGAGFRDDSGLGLAAFTSSSNDAMFLGGGQIGADYQFSPNWVVGIEGQISGLSDNNRSFTSAGFALRDRSDWLGSVTGRLGYTWGAGMIYGKGGVAFRDDNNLSLVTVPGAANVPFTTNREDVGYTLGGGFEYMIAPSWSAKVEYQYYNFDDTRVTTVGAPFAGPGVSYRDDLHTVKVGVNYRFGSLGGGRY